MTPYLKAYFVTFLRFATSVIAAIDILLQNYMIMTMMMTMMMMVILLTITD